jgi:DNA-binding MarR family transcriptional regulator
MNQAGQRRQIDQNLGYRIKLLSQSLNRRLQNVLNPFDLTSFQWEILDHLWREDDVPISTLTRKLQQLGGTLTGAIDALEKRGLVYRMQDQKDRRIYRICLTSEGGRLKQKVLPSVEKLKEETFECLSDDELKILSDLVDRVISHTSRG